MAVLDTVKAEIEDLQGLVSREVSYDIRVLNCTTLIEKIAEMKGNSDPLPSECPFENYEEWVADVEKDLKSAQNSLANVAEAKELLVALNMYVEQNPAGV